MKPNHIKHLNVINLHWKFIQDINLKNYAKMNNGQTHVTTARDQLCNSLVIRSSSPISLKYYTAHFVCIPCRSRSQHFKNQQVTPEGQANVQFDPGQQPEMTHINTFLRPYRMTHRNTMSHHTHSCTKLGGASVSC